MLSGQARWKEIMGSPISRLEVSEMETRMLEKVMSTALAIEALEGLLVKRGILSADELMAEVGELVKQKHEQAKAADAASSVIEVT